MATKASSTTNPPRLLIIGPQGAGKGTQGIRIATAFGVPMLSTGDLFRKEVAQETELGLRVKYLIEAGELVPDDVTSMIVRDRLGGGSARHGFILDGYPRNLRQVEALDDLLRDEQAPLNAVVALRVPREESITRIQQRARLEGRADDTHAAMITRLEIYHTETEPLLEEMERRGVLLDIDGMGDVDLVTDRVFDALRAEGIDPPEVTLGH